MLNSSLIQNAEKVFQLKNGSLANILLINQSNGIDVLCYKDRTEKGTRKDTTVMNVCLKCNVHLCLGSCFEKYHTRSKYWTCVKNWSGAFAFLSLTELPFVIFVFVTNIYLLHFYHFCFLSLTGFYLLLYCHLFGH